MTSSPEPHFGVNIEEEMNQSYVKAYRSEFDVPDDKLVEAIEYLGRLVGGKLYSELWCNTENTRTFDGLNFNLSAGSSSSVDAFFF